MNSKTFALVHVKPFETFLFSGLLIGMVCIPLIRIQIVSGSLVNAALIFASIVLGSRAGYALAVVPSLVAFGSGLLPSVAVTFIPFIMASNVILVAVVSGLSKKNTYTLGVSSGVIAKTIFLILTGSLVGAMMQSATFADLLSTMFGWIQLLTASLGGLIAYGAIRLFRKE